MRNRVAITLLPGRWVQSHAGASQPSAARSGPHTEHCHPLLTRQGCRPSAWQCHGQRMPVSGAWNAPALQQRPDWSNRTGGGQGVRAQPRATEHCHTPPRHGCHPSAWQCNGQRTPVSGAWNAPALQQRPDWSNRTGGGQGVRAQPRATEHCHTPPRHGCHPSAWQCNGQRMPVPGAGNAPLLYRGWPHGGPPRALWCFSQGALPSTATSS